MPPQSKYGLPDVAPSTIPYPHRVVGTMDLPLHGRVDVVFEGDPPPTAPLAGDRVSLVSLPKDKI